MDSFLINFINTKELLEIQSDQEISSISDLSIIELKNSNYDKALKLSEEIIKANSKAPIGWLLKALAESNLITFENNMFDSSFNSMDKANLLSNNNKVLKNEIMTIFLSGIVQRYANIVQSSIESSDSLKEKAEEEKTKAAAAALLGVLGGVVTASSSSTVGKVVGGATMGAGATGAISKFKSSEDFLKLAKGIYGLALTGIKVTVPLITHLMSIQDNISLDLKNYVSQSIELWKISAIKLYNKELEIICDYLETKREKLTKSEEEFKGFIASSGSLIEIEQLIYLGDIVGLDKHKSFKVLKNLEKDLKDFSEGQSETLITEQFKRKKILKYVFGIGTFIFPGIISPLEGTVLYGILIFVWLSFPVLWWYFASKYIIEIQRHLSNKLEEYHNDLLYQQVKLSDIDIKLLSNN